MFCEGEPADGLWRQIKGRTVLARKGVSFLKIKFFEKKPVVCKTILYDAAQ